MTDKSHAAPATHAVEAEPADLSKRRQIVRRARWLVIVLALVLAALAIRTVIARMANARALERNAGEHATQYVNTVVVKSAESGQTLALPGTLQGFMQSPIAARSGGYLRRWYRDIGSSVQKGELLAEIETPEIDQQLSQAVAARNQTASSLELAKSTVARWEALRKRDAVSQQDLDERRSADAQARANLAAADANVERLRQLQGFKRVVAPFAGVITRRNVDVGDLIDPGSGGGRAMFVLTQTDPLRVYISVPQSYAQLIKPGQKVVVTQAELRGQSFQGEVARSAGSIDTVTRAMQVEVALPNKSGTLLPGAFVQVSLPLPASAAMTIPANALLFRADGILVAAVEPAAGARNPGGKIRLKPVRIGRNYGVSVEVLSGLAEGDRLVLNPADSLAEGDEVAIAAPSAVKAAP